MPRAVKFREDANVEPCPKCGNRRAFTIHSQQVAEDLCEVWAVCQCGHETPDGYRYEDVWGGCDDGNVMAAISCWNDAIAEAQAATPNAALTGAEHSEASG